MFNEDSSLTRIEPSVLNSHKKGLIKLQMLPVLNERLRKRFKQ